MNPLKKSSSNPLSYVSKDASPDVSLFDLDNPVSIINMCEEALSRAIQGIPPRYLRLTETQLRKEVKPDEVLCRLKLSFWDEYERAQEKKRKIHAVKVFSGVCQKEHFYDVVLTDPLKVCWMVTPPVDHMLQLREILDLGLMQMRRMIQLPFVYRETKIDAQGNSKTIRKVDAKVMSQINSAVNTLLDRVHGAVLQKNQNLNLTVTKNADLQLTSDTASLEDLDAMEKKLDRIANQIKEIVPQLKEPEVMDIEVLTEDGELERVVVKEDET